MKKIISILIAVFLLTGILSGCAGGSTSTGKSEKVTLNVYNWGDYIDEDLLKQFEEETGMKVNYEIFATNEEMLAKVQAGGTDYDIIMPSDYIIEYMRNNDLLLPINYENIPNYANIDSRFKNLEYDPDGKYSVPYIWGTMGIIYNKAVVTNPGDSWRLLWDKNYSGKIAMLDSPRDTIGITLKMLGYDINSRDLAQLEEAKKALIEQKPLVNAYTIDNYRDMLASGEVDIALAWSGDAMLLMSENPGEFDYMIPKEGTNLWFDAMAIPKTSKHQKEAEAFINFMLDPKVAAKNADYIKFSSPNEAALQYLPQEDVVNPNLYPKGDLKNLGEVFLDLGDFTKEYDRLWTEIKS